VWDGNWNWNSNSSTVVGEEYTTSSSRVGGYVIVLVGDSGVKVHTYDIVCTSLPIIQEGWWLCREFSNKALVVPPLGRRYNAIPALSRANTTMEASIAMSFRSSSSSSSSQRWCSHRDTFVVGHWQSHRRFWGHSHCPPQICPRQ
jgi:hypothetical protein